MDETTLPTPDDFAADLTATDELGALLASANAAPPDDFDLPELEESLSLSDNSFAQMLADAPAMLAPPVQEADDASAEFPAFVDDSSPTFGEVAEASATDLFDSTAHERHLVFTLDSISYAIPVVNMIEIGRPLPVTRLPFVPAWMLGIVNLRGDIISVVCLRTFLDMTPPDTNARGQRMIVVRSATNEIVTCLLVDGVREIRYLELDRINRSPFDEHASRFLHATYTDDDGRTLRRLDTEALLSSPQMRLFETAGV